MVLFKKFKILILLFLPRVIPAKAGIHAQDKLRWESKIRSRIKCGMTNAGFTLIEVLVSIGLLGTLVITVAYMTIANQSELLRHNAESYADLIASNQFSSLVAYRNQIAFDNQSSTNWQTNLFREANPGAKKWVRKNADNSFTLINASGGREEIKTLGNGMITLHCELELEKMLKPTGVVDTDLLKAHLKIKYSDRGGERTKDYYTVIANYL